MKLTEEEKINKKYEKQILKEEKEERILKEKEYKIYEKEHTKYLETLEKIATGELKVNLNMIASFIASQVSSSDIKFKGVDFKECASILDKNNGSVNKEFRDVLTSVLKTKYEDTSNVINKLIANPRLNYLYDEYKESCRVQDIIVMDENYKEYKKTVNEIINTYDEEYLPKIGYGMINRRIASILNNNKWDAKFNNEEINILREAYANNTLKEKTLLLYSHKGLDFANDIYNMIINDDKLKYLDKEYKLVNEQKKTINYNIHENNMEIIHRATRLRQIQDFKEATLTTYLNGNTTIYTNDDRIKTDDLKYLGSLLLDGYTWESNEVKDEIDTITKSNYPDKADASSLLINKLSKLPKTNYLIEEINAAKKREEEILALDAEASYTYNVEDKKNSKIGGVFVRVYLSSRPDLELQPVIDKVKDLDSLESYVQEHIDPTFAAVGGMILCKDEFNAMKDTSRNVTVYNFKQNTGKAEIEKEEKEKFDRIQSLDAEILKKETELENILNNLNELKGIINKLYDHVNEDTNQISKIRK